MAKRDAKHKPYGPAYQKAVVEHGIVCGLKSGPLAVLKALASFCNGDSGQAWPSKETLCMDAGQGKRTTQRHLRALEAAEIITPIAYAEGGRERATCYTFCLPQWSRPRWPEKGARMARLREIKGANLSLKGANLSLKGANLAYQQREQYRTDAPAGGHEGRASAQEGAGCGPPFPPWDRVQPFSEYLSDKKAWQKDALRAAENE